MQVHLDIEKLPVFRNAVVTIGTFDGVHMGHRLIIDRLKEKARQINGETVIITFHPHPRMVVSSTILGIRLINTLEEKIELLNESGIDHLVIVHFTEVFANQSAEEYLKNFLIGKFRPNTIIIGFDHRFGKGRKGDYHLLEDMSPVYNYELNEIPQQVLNHIAVSSTKIRESILQSDIETANKLLGYNFFFSGEVVNGDKLGQKLGYPTANLNITDNEKITPGNGIYAVYVEEIYSGQYPRSKDQGPGSRIQGPRSRIQGQGLLKGMMSIGFRPTLDGKKRVVEVNIFEFDKNIYGNTLRVYVKKYLRPEIKFDTVEELVTQIGKDKVESLKAL